MRKEKRDPYDIKKFEEVLGESIMMVPDSQSRFQKSIEDLSLFYETNSPNLDPESEWFDKAKKLLVQFGFMKADDMIVDDDVTETNLDQLRDGEAF